MKLLGIVVIAVLAIVLAHWTIENLLSARPHNSDTRVGSGSLDLLEYVRTRLSGDKNENAREPAPHAQNFYSNAHPSDLHHEITDLSKFFEVQQSVPDTKELLREINASAGGCSGGLDAYGQCLPATDSVRDAQSGNPMKFDYGSDGSATMMPDHWSYQNENIMNGGLFDGVRPFDDKLSDFTVYPTGDANKPDGMWTSSYPYTQSFGKW